MVLTPQLETELRVAEELGKLMKRFGVELSAVEIRRYIRNPSSFHPTEKQVDDLLEARKDRYPLHSRRQAREYIRAFFSQRMLNLMRQMVQKMES